MIQNPERRLIHVSFMIDTNCINARQKIEALNQLERWAADELIALMTAETAQREMSAGGNAQRTRKAYTFIFSMSEITTAHERQLRSKIEKVLFPNGATEANQRNDVDIVFNAAKYVRPLITMDGASQSQPGGILGNRQALESLGISVLTPDEAVARVQDEIRKRDQFAREWAEYLKKPIPSWVGKD
jgi:hypothetical protein